MKAISILGTGTRPGKTLLSTAFQRVSPGYYTRINGSNSDYHHLHRYSPNTKFIQHNKDLKTLFDDMKTINEQWVIESDGGILSNLKEGFQADVLANLHPHTFLVGDDTPNGISATLMTYECLSNRSIDIKTIVFFQPPHLDFQRFVSCPVMYLLPPPMVSDDPLLDYTNMLVWYESIHSTIESILEDID